MAKNIAKVKSTGGYGFNFEDKVAATCLVRMLDGLEVFGLAGMRATKMTFQTRASGWLLDDLLLHLSGASGSVKCGVSIKSAAYLTRDGFKSDFVQDLWDQWHGSSAGPFDRTRDRLALAVGSLSESALKVWGDIEKRARWSDPDHLAKQLSTKGSSSAMERAIFASLLPDSELNKGTKVSDSARLLARLSVQLFSKLTDTTEIRDCASLLFAGDLTSGAALWEKLQCIASDRRVVAGTIELADLLGLLRGGFQLKEHPDYNGAWESLNRHSHANCEAVHSVTGVDTRIVLDGVLADVTAKAKKRATLAVIGESGVGKSSLMKGYVQSIQEQSNLIWLSGEELAVQSQLILAKQLGLMLELPNLIRHSTRSLVLIVDAIDQFPTLALKRLAEIVVALRDSDQLDFRVLLTAQPLRWEQARIEVYSWNTSAVEEFPFSGPSFDNVFAALAGNEMVRPLLFRPELRRVVTNLATLDQIVKATSTQQLLSSRDWIGETEVIDWVWKSWIGKDALQHQRGALLRLLGEEDGNSGPAIPLSRIPYGTTARLGDPEIASLTRTDASAVRFHHEVVADWARYHALKSEGSLRLQKILELIQNPRWIRAIRLYSQSLLEETKGLSAWEKIFASFEVSDSENQIAADVFSDSLVLATNSQDLLERVWPALIADGARRLKRLMKRIMIVATLPLPAGDFGEEYSDAASVLMRFPIPAYWGGLLQVLSAHAQEVAAHCLSEAGDLCAFYLRVMPWGYGKRKMVARLVLTVAAEAERGLSDRKYYLRDSSRAVFEALLRAGAEYPDEVGQMTLSLAERLSADDESQSERVTRASGISWGLLGERREPWPDGPRRRVEESFQNAVLNTDALAALMKFRPAIASEVLLAVCIEEPQHEGEASGSSVFNGGFAYWHQHMPAMYFTGPFLRFLQISPQEGLATIVRLVDFATDRWLQAFSRFNGSGEKPSYKLYFDGFDKGFIGDGNVYHWHRDIRLNGIVAESALMAVEKWLYDKIDAKEDVAEDVSKILVDAKSAAFLGLLVAVGLYSPELFRGPLRPLLSCPDLYITQGSTLLQETWKMFFDVIWGRYGNRISALVRAWNEMPHRKYELYGFAQRSLFFDSEITSALDSYRQRWLEEWEREVDSDRVVPTTLELFIAKLDRSNYSATDIGDDQVEIKFRVPSELESRLNEERIGPALNLSAMSLIAQARRAIDESKALPDDEAQQIFTRLEEIVKAEGREGTFEKYRAEAIAAGIALLVTGAGHWLSRISEKENVCLQQLFLLAESEPKTKEFDSPESISDGQDTFVSEAALQLLLAGRKEEWLWGAALRGITSYRYGTTEKLMLTVFRHRSQDSLRFTELVGAVVLWAVVRAPVTMLGNRYDASILAPYQRLVSDRFKRGYFRTHPVDLAHAVRLNQRFARLKLRRTPQWEWQEQRMGLLESARGTAGTKRE